MIPKCIVFRRLSIRWDTMLTIPYPCFRNTFIGYISICKCWRWKRNGCSWYINWAIISSYSCSFYLISNIKISVKFLRLIRRVINYVDCFSFKPLDHMILRALLLEMKKDFVFYPIPLRRIDSAHWIMETVVSPGLGFLMSNNLDLI
jgi:hypothetical protein